MKMPRKKMLIKGDFSFHVPKCPVILLLEFKKKSHYLEPNKDFKK